ncbi:ZYRO0F02024p [Zygosaccharomyces rouxii]|uniref:ZYRO0F02024p n=1 Tax=Zygosaccharomyces rouxii (strain ATCC 2623 / CBS 732 / NBRC 1130 / NCYC 568 / NRRL Y-229) TaxID=559307 RepID=C5DX40_ZYGRC|nr:uncharacterized protein ZYRO0F02024g [Zygosaccharomyces rouxii]CAR28351.1 ZYRO0F02024p [Zygosaccharomyces rouxii]
MFALEFLYQYARTRSTFKTLIDALQSFVEASNNGAREGAGKTRQIDPLVESGSYSVKREL